MTEPDPRHVDALTAIIREVDGGYRLESGIALAKAILAHPNSRWSPQPALPDVAPPEVLSLAVHNANNQEDAARLAWACALAEIDRQGSSKPAPAPAAFPVISDDLIRMLIRDVQEQLATSVEQMLIGRPFDPIPSVRARLLEILQMAADDAAKGGAAPLELIDHAQR